MAKKKITTLGIFAKTEPSANPTETPRDDLVESFGVGLRHSEWQDIKNIAAELNMKYHALAVVFIRYGLQAYKEGKMKTKTAKTLDI